MSDARANLAIVRQRWPLLAARVEPARRVKLPPPRPRAEAEYLARLWLQGRRIHAGALLAVTGWGDGVHVQALLAVLPPRARVFVGVADPGELRAIWEREDQTGLLADPRLTLGAGACDAGFFRGLEKVPVLHVTDVQAMVFAPEYNRAPAWHAQFLAEFARHVDVRRKLEGTRVADAALWQANTFANLPHLVSAPDVGILRGAFAGLPLVIVSAGPSLDESLEFLRAASRVAVVVAVNSSYRAVRNAGIVPPLVLAADPRGFTMRGFTGVPVNGTHLVTTHIVHPDVTRLFEGRAFTWTGDNELVQALRRRAALAPGTPLVEQGTVSACAVDLAVLLGCDRICFVGQDLAVRDDGRSHAQDSFYTDLDMNETDVGECRRLPGNTRPEVLVEGKLYVYLKVFEQLVAQRRGLKWLNTARLGARIEGVPYAEFDDALRWLGSGSAARVPAVLASRHAAGAGQCLSADRLRSALAGTRTFARDVLEAALAAVAGVESLPDSVLQKGGAEDPKVPTAQGRIDDLQKLLDLFPEETAILEAGRTRLEMYRAHTAEAQVAHLEEHARRLLLGREFGWAVAEGAWFLLHWIERLESEIVAKAPLAPGLR